MSKSNKKWIVWLVFSFALTAGLYYQLDSAEDKSLLMPGPLSDGHHQFADKCETCHTSEFGGTEVLEKTCVECHGEERVKPHDSHPAHKFKDPRNANLLESIDVLSCTTCHTEHKTEITLKDGLTQPIDFCIHCHADVGKDRETHEGLEFNSCKSSGCHNFHNNRAIYTDYLVKHLDEDDLLSRHKVKAREFSDVIGEIMEYPHGNYPVKPLTAADADMPAGMRFSDAIMKEWLSSGHAESGVNCSACHSASNEDKKWSDKVSYQSCNTCHDLEVKRFKGGKHGMRWAADLPDMKVADARLPMHEAAGHQTLNCNTCHGTHDYNSKQAAYEACTDCHSDEHTLAYESSPHAKTWRAELDGTAPKNSGVSCATCHMPRISYDVNDWVTRIMVDHNQSANLSPNSKMARNVCMHCHGLDFALKALADPEQIKTNFATSPAQEEHPSMQLARRDEERALRETSGNQ